MHKHVRIRAHANKNARCPSDYQPVIFAKACLNGCFRVVSHVSMRNKTRKAFGSASFSPSFALEASRDLLPSKQLVWICAAEKSHIVILETAEKAPFTWTPVTNFLATSTDLSTELQAQATPRCSLYGVSCFRCGSAVCGPGCGCGYYCWC